MPKSDDGERKRDPGSSAGRVVAQSGGRFVTSGDVARLAGVSRSAVSRTFTPGASVSAKTEQRVRAAAAALGYRVNRLAQSLIGNTSNLVGIVISNLSAPFMAAQLDALSHALLQGGLQTLLLNAAEGTRDMERLISLILEFRVRAIVVMSGRPPREIVEVCIRNRVRVILINTLTDADAVDTVLIDDAGGGRLAADRLIAAGCRSLALVNGRPRTYNHRLRASAFVARVQEADVSLRVWEAEASDYKAGLTAAIEVADAGIDGVFCTTDLTALGLMDGIRRRQGRRVPEDVSVIGFDDIPQAGWDLYRLTTIRQPIGAIVSEVIDAIDRRDAPASSAVIVPVELVERESVKPA